jgi:putative molybdopterin biosynthesis protein
VAVIPTGDEIVPVGSPARLGEILDTNSLMLVAQAQEVGCEAWATPIRPDVVEQISAAVRDAAAGAGRGGAAAGPPRPPAGGPAFAATTGAA